MKEQVLDIVLVLKSINGKIDGLTKQLDIANKRIDFLEKENAQLKSRLAIYETPKDSHNSSIPPSKESLSAQAKKANKLQITQSLREKSGKPTGGQVGHKGSTLEMVSNPDAVIEHQSNFCTRCGNDLSEVEGSVSEVRQLFDIPLPIRPIITEHRTIEKKCSCGTCCKSEFPAHVRSRVCYGENIRALVTYLSSIQSIPYKRLTEVLYNCFGVALSQGTIDNILKEMSDKSLGVYDEIRNKVLQSRVVGADETGVKINGKLNWMWVWQTNVLTYIHSDKSRGKLAIENNFAQGLPNSILITDRHSSYFNMNVADHQICLAHILRELIYLTEFDKNQSWSTNMTELIRDAIHKRKAELWTEIDREYIMEKFKCLLETLTEGLHQKTIALLKSLTKFKEYVFKFLFEPDVPYDNNASERAVRVLKVKQKVSGMFKTDIGADTFSQIQSIAQTAKKNHQNPFLAILAVAKNH